MITALAFVVAFIVIALAVLAAAFSGRRSEVDQPPSPSRAARRAVVVVTGILIIVLGIVIPALIIGNTTSNAKAPGGVRLNAAEQRGRLIFGDHCATCHTLRAANAVGKVGPNLDQLRPPKALVLDAIKNGRARGLGQMPADLVDGKDAQDVASFVATVAGR